MIKDDAETEDEGKEDDEFWQLALWHNINQESLNASPEEDGFGFAKDEEECDVTSSTSVGSLTTTTTLYNIPWRRSDNDDDDDDDDYTVPLQLSPLPDHDGIWSPLGAQAWYASSLLVSYLLQHLIFSASSSSSTTNNLLYRHLNSWRSVSSGADAGGTSSSTTSSVSRRFTALELGSGAVGLSGIVLGLILEKYFPSSSSVILTDNEPKVLKQLKHNIHNTILQQPASAELRVDYLDWNDPDSTGLILREKDNKKKNNQIQLVIGSELVYTYETAQACLKVVLSILQNNPNVLIFILQVSDRDGWRNIFLKTLIEKYQNDDMVPVVVQEEDSSVVNDYTLHEMAQKLIPSGGTLDRWSFGACYIYHKEGSVAKRVRSS